MAHRTLDTCDLCGVKYTGELPAVRVSGWPPGGWRLVDCSGGGCGKHVVCDDCHKQFGFINVIGTHLVKCHRHLTDADWSLIALRTMA